MASLMKFTKYCMALGRIIVIIVNNFYCIPTYVVWMLILTPLKYIKPKYYYKIEGHLFHWLLAVVAMWSESAGYKIIETGDDISICEGKRTLIVANHQSTADVPLLMATFNVKGEVLTSIMWIMDRLFKFTNFGIVSVIHGDFFISSGKKNRNSSIMALQKHVKSCYLKSSKKWIVLFPEGGFLRKRKEISINFAMKNNLPVLEYVTIPRVGAFQAIIDSMASKDKDINCFEKTCRKYSALTSKLKSLTLEYVVDITIAYPDRYPLNLSDIVLRLRDPCQTYLYYRLYEASSIPQETDALKQWLYDRFIEKNTLLENFYKYGKFDPSIAPRELIVHQDMLRFVLINLFFIISTYFHLKLMYKIFAKYVIYLNPFSV